MQSGFSAAHDALLVQLDTAAVELPEFTRDDGRQRFRAFLRCYYKTAAPDTLHMRLPQVLLATALGHWRYVHRRDSSAPMLLVAASRGKAVEAAGSLVLAHRAEIERSEQCLAEVQADGSPDFMAVAVREVRKLRLLS